jgi:hypothetical protein
MIATLAQENGNARVLFARETPIQTSSPEHGTTLFPRVARVRALANWDVQVVMGMVMIVIPESQDSFPFVSHDK